MAADPWTKEQKAAEAAFILINIIDWGQTLDIAKNPDTHSEMNPILGEHPSVSDVNVYFFASNFFHIAVTHYLPSKYRKYWQGITFGISASLVIRNNSIGLKVNF